jgi:DNA-binding transcriptional MerR regulator
MDDVRYMISEASKKVDVEAHVLRYWEEELELPIARNEMGHRYYKKADIELLMAVKQLKEQGFQLKAVKILLSDLPKMESLNKEVMVMLKNKLDGKVANMYDNNKISENNKGTDLVSSHTAEKLRKQSNDKMEQFKAIMNHIIISALKENNVSLTEKIGSNVTEGVIKEMNFLMRVKEEREEERYKRFDATLREYQKSKILAATSSDEKNRRKSKFFKKHKVYI